MIYEFANVNNKLKPPVTNLIHCQIWSTTHRRESTGSKESIGVSCMYVCSKLAKWELFFCSKVKLSLHSYNTSKFLAGEKVVASYVCQPIRSEYGKWAAKVGRWDDNYWPSTVPIQSYSKILATHHRGVIGHYRDHHSTSNNRDSTKYNDTIIGHRVGLSKDNNNNNNNNSATASMSCS